MKWKVLHRFKFWKKYWEKWTYLLDSRWPQRPLPLYIQGFPSRHSLPNSPHLRDIEGPTSKIPPKTQHPRRLTFPLGYSHWIQVSCGVWIDRNELSWERWKQTDRHTTVASSAPKPSSHTGLLSKYTFPFTRLPPRKFLSTGLRLISPELINVHMRKFGINTNPFKS